MIKKQTKAFRTRIVVTLAVVVIALAIIISVMYLHNNSSTALGAPSIKDPILKVETLVSGLSSPTSMAFIDSNNNILVLDKGGQIRLVSNGILQDKPVLQVPVDTQSERGLLGIAVMNSTKTNIAANTTTTRTNNSKYVFLYYTNPRAGILEIEFIDMNGMHKAKVSLNPI